jgi:arginase
MVHGFRMAGALLLCLVAMNAATRESGARRPPVVLDAPSNLGLRPPSPGVEPGVRRLPDALREHDLVARLKARDAGRVVPPPYSPAPDEAVGFRNGTSLATYTRALAPRIGALVDAGELVIVLGGDCSVLLGAAVALRERGRYGLAFIDAHDDYTYPRDRARYAGIMTAAGLDLGLATGHGPPALVDIGGLQPYFRETDVVHLGLAREAGDHLYGDVDAFERSAIMRVDRAAIRRDGAAAAARIALERLERSDLDGYWIHIDADVLARDVMPAVDSPSADGLRVAELGDLLAFLLRSERVRGIELTIFDPDLDPDGRYARTLADLLVDAFTASGRVAPVVRVAPL